MNYQILTGDALDLLKQMPDASVHCVVTSPPYWGLRDYGVPGRVWGGDSDCEHEWVSAGKRGAKPDRSTGDHDANGSGMFVDRIDCGSQASKAARGAEIEFGSWCSKCDAWFGAYGLEPTHLMFVEHTVVIFREVRRVLRYDGTLWLNFGDSYADDSKWGGVTGGKHVKALHDNGMRATRARKFTGLKKKDLVGIPWRVALALQDDGWYLRKDNIWHKKNPMPESARDRTTTSHEYIFHFSKRPKYFYDAYAVREPASWNSHHRGKGVNPKADTGVGWDKRNIVDVHDMRQTRVRVKQNDSFSSVVREVVTTRNLRSVWTFTTQAFKEAHFATFPEELPRRCIKAGTSAYGCCASCGAPYKRLTDRSVRFAGGSGASLEHRDTGETHLKSGKHEARRDASSGQYDIRMGPVVHTSTIGWCPTCKCNADVVPCRVLDPFSGAATTGVAALKLGRNYIGLELNPKYVEMSTRRLEATIEEIKRPAKPKKQRKPVERGQLSLIGIDKQRKDEP